MALNYDTLTALINEKYMPTLYDQFFKKTNYLVNRLKAKAKTFNGRKIVVPLEYADGSNAQATTKYQHINLAPIDPITAAEYEPKMITDSLIISLEEELVMNSDMAVKNILDAKMKNVLKGTQKYFLTRFWARSTATADWNSLYTAVLNSGTFGGIDSATYTWWQSHVLDAATLGGGDPSLEADLMDPTKPTYLKKLLQRGIALCKTQTGEDPDIINVPQYIWDLLELILDPQKTGSKMSEKAGSMGFKALDFRGIDIVADNAMVVAQTGATDGYMEFLNLDYLWMFFNSGAKFKAQPFVRPGNANYKSCLINAYGNLCVSNRGAHCRIINVRSPKEYAGLS